MFDYRYKLTISGSVRRIPRAPDLIRSQEAFAAGRRIIRVVEELRRDAEAQGRSRPVDNQGGE